MAAPARADAPVGRAQPSRTAEGAASAALEVGEPQPSIDARVDASASESLAARGPGWSPALGVQAEMNGWIGPAPVAVWGASVDAVSPSRGGSVRAAGAFGTSERSLGGRRAEFSYWGAHLDLCPVAFGSLSSWRWTGCAELHLGLLRASGDERSSLANGLSQRALLATAVATSRLQTPPLWGFSLEVEAGLAAPLLRQTFRFGAPEEVIFETPALGLLARAGVRVPFGGQLD